MNGFKFDFSKIFWGGAHRAPSPDPSPDFSRASPSVQASPSILGRFAPSTRASPSILGRFAPSIRASPLTFDWGLLFGPPQNKFLDPPLNNDKSTTMIPSLNTMITYHIFWNCFNEWKWSRIQVPQNNYIYSTNHSIGSAPQFINECWKAEICYEMRWIE